jgi:serine/threonine-protein kinase
MGPCSRRIHDRTKPLIQYSLAALEQSFSRFATFKLLGQGGEGAVFSVWDRIRKIDLALKLMRDSGEEDIAERFELEYATLASSRSERLVRVYDHGMEAVPVAGGEELHHYWYTMEKCESSVRKTFRRMPLDRRVDVAMQTLDGLAFLHAKRIAHRDIKPDNIFLVKGTEVKIGDFGLARAHSGGGEGGALLSEVRGSPPYLAPERWLGAYDEDWRPSDQYAAGVTIFELLSAGRAPLDFGQTQASYCEAHLGGRVFPLRVPEMGARGLPSVDAVLARMLAKAPGERYADVAECKRELAAALALDGVTEGRQMR